MIAKERNNSHFLKKGKKNIETKNNIYKIGKSNYFDINHRINYFCNLTLPDNS